ncbi:outer membrane lipoprotein chaperone LolA [Paucibacter sp. KCTC 42545]|uniref:outer membrane lipoprotein chaperone LolA n=1 Tax=Paucibacter sp. KCTC 42545 TaxID=1768242 RepID=UPI000733C044|nr:outer membrane lipoprotein chaperone LolA [Paucibacter sp. KCTC 42545]ALT79758.1 outer membrane lipoprotein carrier protein LolA [Paucibacter sp. KCTC 42545]
MKLLNRIKSLGLAGLLMLAGAAQADGVSALKDFVREVKSGRAEFTQTVSSPDGVRKKMSSGTFEFQRPNQFRFAYTKPFEQLIVADGQKVWIFDPDLKQASSRRMNQALGATPAALLAGGNLERDFKLKALASEEGLDWVQAEPKLADGGFQSLKIGFKGSVLAALEIVDGFGQRSRLDFSAVNANASVAAERFRFVLPAGADLIEQ